MNCLRDRLAGSADHERSGGRVSWSIGGVSALRSTCHYGSPVFHLETERVGGSTPASAGALIETDLTLPLLSQVTMEIALPRHARRGCIKLPGAYVVRKTPEGYGLEWQDLISAEFLAISWRVGSTVSQSGGHTRCQ